MSAIFEFFGYWVCMQNTTATNSNLFNVKCIGFISFGIISYIEWYGLVACMCLNVWHTLFVRVNIMYHVILNSTLWYVAFVNQTHVIQLIILNFNDKLNKSRAQYSLSRAKNMLLLFFLPSNSVFLRLFVLFFSNLLCILSISLCLFGVSIWYDLIQRWFEFIRCASKW